MQRVSENYTVLHINISNRNKFQFARLIHKCCVLACVWHSFFYVGKEMAQSKPVKLSLTSSYYFVVAPMLL